MGRMGERAAMLKDTLKDTKEIANHLREIAATLPAEQADWLKEAAYTLEGLHQALLLSTGQRAA